jgi:hypothetical protein
MEKIISALQYQELLMKLPSPTTWLELDRGKIIELNYLKDQARSKEPILNGNLKDGVSLYAEIEQLSFRLCTDTLIPHWKPTIIVKII